MSHPKRVAPAMSVAVRDACPDPSAIERVGGELHCSRCESEVIDLRYVTEREAKAMIAREIARRGRVCRRLFTDAEGRPSFLVERPQGRRLPVLPMAFAASIASACASEAPQPVPVAPGVAAALVEPAVPDVASPLVDPAPLVHTTTVVDSTPVVGTGAEATTSAEAANVVTASVPARGHDRSRAPRTRRAVFQLEGF